ncbi:MAG TPA: cytochrome b N-terminal domain-containing protein [Pseudolysinimonas sp.]
MTTTLRPARRSFSDRLADRLTQGRTGRQLTGLVTELQGRVLPLHWSNMFGVVSAACLVILFLSGGVLMFFYSPSSDLVTYHGGYAALDGATVSKAFGSTMAISFDLPGGLLLRQAHHWAALLLPASIIVQLLVTFFTGGFRTPRRASWVLLFLALIAALVAGWSGYALPDDLLSGTGLRIVQGIVLGIPLIGTWASALLFGGQFPGQIIQNLYPIHLIAPIALVVLIALRIRLAYRNGPAQFAGEGRDENTVIGVPVLPSAAARGAGVLFIVMGLILVIASAFTVSPIWLYGPSSPGDASAGSQPDWYTGFLDGALRLVPPGWEFVWLGRTWTLAILVPLVVVGVYLAAALLYPFLEQWLTGDRREHNILDRPRNAPTRTGIGVAGIVFYGVLWGAASSDLIATQFRLTLESVIRFDQIALVAGPVIALVIARRVCFALQEKDREILLHGFETGRIVRLPGGEYTEIHQPVSEHEKWRLVNTSDYEPLQVRPDRRGHLGGVTRARAALSRLFFEDRIAPIPSTETLGEHDALALSVPQRPE